MHKGKEGGDDDAAALARNLNPFKRKLDKPAVFWSRIVDSGPEEKTVIFDVPESFAGSLRIMAVAASPDAMAAARDSRGSIRAVSDSEILAAFRLLASKEGMFCEPASAAAVAGLLKYGAEGAEQIVCVLTGRGLKDPETAIAHNDGRVIPCPVEIERIEEAVLGDP